jgi:hypothetical protein
MGLLALLKTVEDAVDSVAKDDIDDGDDGDDVGERLGGMYVEMETENYYLVDCIWVMDYDGKRR